MPIKEAYYVRVFWESAESVWEWSDEKKRERGGSSPAAICSRVCELGVEWSSSSMYLLYPFSISNKMNLSRGCRQFAEPRKILCQCALPSAEQLSVHSRSAHVGAGKPQQRWCVGFILPKISGSNLSMYYSLILSFCLLCVVIDNQCCTAS
jgi:hypothetical protein